MERGNEMENKISLKNKKLEYIFPIIYITFIYVFTVLFIFGFIGDPKGEVNEYGFTKEFIFTIKYGLILIGILIILNIINGILMVKSDKTSKQILFLAVIMKMSFILLYGVYFFIEIITFCTVIGIAIAVILFIFGYIVLIPSSFYTVCGLMRAYKNNEISILYAICFGTLSFMLFLDVFFTVASYIKVRKMSFSSNYQIRLNFR